MNKPPSGYFRAISVIHAALVAGQVLFTLALVFLISIVKFPATAPQLENIFTYVVPVISFAAIIGGNIYFNKLLVSVQAKTDIKEKAESYRMALVSRYAILEAPSLFGLVVTLMTANYLFLIYPGTIILYFIYLRPAKNKICTDLGISESELDQL